MTFAIRSRGLIKSASINKSFFPGNCKTCMLTFTIQIQNAKSFSEETGEFKETVEGHVTCSSRKMSWSLASLLSREKSGSPGASLLSVCAIWRDPTTLSEAGYTCKTFLSNITVTQICGSCMCRMTSITRLLQLLSEFCSCH